MNKISRLMINIRQTPAFQFIWRLYTNLNEDYVGLVAAGIAFYFLMAAFPAMAAAISLYGLFSNPHFIPEQLDLIAPFLPGAALRVLADQARAIASSNESILSISFMISIIFSVYSATKGMNALMQGFNIAYNEKEKRNILLLQAVAFILTMVMMIYYLVSLTMVAGIPVFLSFIHAPESIAQGFLWCRWPLLFVIAILGLEILYYYGPAHRRPRWKWFSWGSVSATVLWLVISALFSLFVSNFGRYNETYGSISAIILLLLWFWLSALMILLGAEINSLLADRHRVASKPEDCSVPPLPEKP